MCQFEHDGCVIMHETVLFVVSNVLIAKICDVSQDGETEYKY